MTIIMQTIMFVAFLASGVLGYYFYSKSKYEQRKMLIEKGININSFTESERRFKFPWLKIGIVIIGLSMGLIIIVILVNYDLIGKSDAIYPAIIGICGGISFIVAHYLGNAKKSE